MVTNTSEVKYGEIDHPLKLDDPPQKQQQQQKPADRPLTQVKHTLGQQLSHYEDPTDLVIQFQRVCRLVQPFSRSLKAIFYA